MPRFNRRKRTYQTWPYLTLHRIGKVASFIDGLLPSGLGVATAKFVDLKCENNAEAKDSEDKQTTHVVATMKRKRARPYIRARAHSAKPRHPWSECLKWPGEVKTSLTARSAPCWRNTSP